MTITRRGALAGALSCRRHRVSARRRLPVAADELDRAVPARRLQRHLRPADRGLRRQPAAPAGGGRESRRRRRHHRRHDRGALEARRLHPAGGQSQPDLRPDRLCRIGLRPDARLRAVSGIAQVPVALVVNPAKVDAKDLAAFLAMARKQPGAINIGSSGLGTIPHLAIVLLQQRTGIQLTHVPYRGGGPALQDLMAGQIDATFAPLSTVASYVQSGRLRALAVAAAKREPVLPDVPTFAQAGVADFTVSTWYGLFAPKATPARDPRHAACRHPGRARRSGHQAHLGRAGRRARPAKPPGLHRVRRPRGRALEPHRADGRVAHGVTDEAGAYRPSHQNHSWMVWRAEAAKTPATSSGASTT